MGHVNAARSVVSFLAMVSVMAALCSCVQSAVPSLDPADFKKPALTELEPRALALQVRDERPVSPEDRRATEAQLVELLRELFSSAGVSMSADARYGLDIVLRQPASEAMGTDAASMDPLACVEMSWGLQAASVTARTSTNSACSEVQNGYGAAAPSVSRAFRRAIRAQLAELERNAADAVALGAPLQFDAAQLTVPPFAWLSSRSLALEVKDELSPGGAAGVALTSSLTEALTRSGLRVSDTERQRLALVLARPQEASSEQQLRMCVELRAELVVAAGRRFVTRQDCPRPGDPLGPRLINGALHGLDGAGPLQRR